MAGEPSPADARRPRPRIESLSDMVFGLALSVGALALVGAPPQTVSALYSDIGAFGFSFLILILVWITYTRIMSVLRVEGPRLIRLNSALLFTVSIEPFLFNLLSRGSRAIFEAVSELYAADLAAMMLLLGFFAYLVATDPTLRLPTSVSQNFQREAQIRTAMAAVFLVSIAPVFGEIELFWGYPLRFVLWAAPLAFGLGIRRGHAAPSAGPSSGGPSL